MAKRKRASKTGRSVKKFVIPDLLKTEPIEVPSYPPTLLKTEQIEVDIKPEIFAPFTDSKSSKITISSDNILTFTCDGCGESGIHHLGLEYRLVKKAMLVETSTQTGDDSNSSGIADEASNVRSLDDSNHLVSVPTSSATSTSVVPYDNGGNFNRRWTRVDSFYFHLAIIPFDCISHCLQPVAF